MVGGIRTACMAMLLALLGTACGGDGGTDSSEGAAAKPPSPGVSFLDYSPKPVRKGDGLMYVRFTTTGPAGPGREYMVWLFTGLDKRDRYCYSEWAPGEGVQGEAGRTYIQAIQIWGEFSDGEADACFGRARLVVWTQESGGPLPRKVMRELVLPILPPAS